jgi:transposase-like protein
MATRKQFEQSRKERQMRTFSVDFKKKKVRELEQKKVTVSEISRQYEVSVNSVYKWLNKYGQSKLREERTIVEAQSDTRKMLEMQKQIAELERIVGQKQVLLDFKDKMIDLAEQEYGVDIKKKFIEKRSSTTGKTEKN